MPARCFSQWTEITLTPVATNSVLVEMELHNAAIVSPATDETNTFLFRSVQSARGILQITGFTDNPRGVKIRYKLVQNAGGSATAE